MEPLEPTRSRRRAVDRSAGTCSGRYGTPAVLGALVAVTLAGCEQVEVVVDQYRDLTPHEAYVESLRAAGLDGTALARDWIDAADEALRQPLAVSLPFREEGWLDPEDPAAVGYRVSLRRGQLVTVEVDLSNVTPDGDAGLFVDIFRVPEDPENPLRPMLNSDTLSLDVTETGQVARFAYDAFRAGDFVIRVQPELLRGGRYRIHLGLGPSLAFPVEGRNEGAIQSFFGAARDGGAREHHGVDIFAPRGTPVLAATDGTVSRANVTNRGGKVVWLQDGRRSQSLYYAHLDSQVVARGDEVQRGDTLGFVGNTGNARTTPPHLHFGIYQRGERGGRRRRRGGPVDPMNFIRPVHREAPGWPADGAPLGGWVRVVRADVNVRSDPVLSGEPAGQLDAGVPLRVEGASDAWWRVRLPDGRAAFIASRVTEVLDGAVDERVATGGTLRRRPDPAAAVVAPLDAGTRLSVLGRFGAYDFVEARLAARDGTAAIRGWIERSADDQLP